MTERKTEDRALEWAEARDWFYAGCCKLALSNSERLNVLGARAKESLRNMFGISGFGISWESIFESELKHEGIDTRYMPRLFSNTSWAGWLQEQRKLVAEQRAKNQPTK